jgi:hypothetical protein
MSARVDHSTLKHPIGVTIIKIALTVGAAWLKAKLTERAQKQGNTNTLPRR